MEKVWQSMKKLMGSIKSKNLSHDDLEFLKEHTCYDEKNIRVWYMTFMQYCLDGKLTQTKFLKLHEPFFPDDFCQKFFKTFDISQKGYLNFREYILAINMTDAGITEDKLKVAFRIFELDRNGKLTFDEMTNIVKDIFKSQKVSATTINAYMESTKISFSKMGINEDEFLTEEEFVTGCLQDELLLYNMILHRHYLDNGGNHYFRSAVAKANLRKSIRRSLKKTTM